MTPEARFQLECFAELLETTKDRECLSEGYAHARAKELRLLLAAPAPPPKALNMIDDQIKHMVNRFLNWRLPENFSPDAGISFKAEFNENTPWPGKHAPMGTNLFDATQAAAMVRHMLEGLPDAASARENAIGAAELAVGQFVYRRIEKLMDAKPGTPESAELSYLAGITANVEEYGALGDEDSSPAPPPKDGPALDREGAQTALHRALSGTLTIGSDYADIVAAFDREVDRALNALAAGEG